jgi:hypothetical protein
MPFYPRSATRQGAHPTPFPLVVFIFGLAVESIKELGVHQNVYSTNCHHTNHNVKTCRSKKKEEPIITIIETTA